jgi:anti-sigma B factor antagonist
MTVNQTQDGNNITLALSGRLDTVTQGELAETLEKIFETGKVNLIFDFSALDYISSAGLRVLLTAQKKVNSLGTAMKITGAKPEVKEIFEMTGFADIMSVE